MDTQTPFIVPGKQQRLAVSPLMVDEYMKWFVNRRAYLVQRTKPDDSGKFSYYAPKDKATKEKLSLTRKDVELHLAGVKTISLYAIEPEQSTCKWIAIDADYDADRVFKDLAKLKYDLSEVGVQAIFEHSRRGGHLWVLAAEPLPASLCRTLVFNLALRLDVPIKGHMSEVEGIEIFPRQNRLEPGYYGNAIRGPLGVHRATCKRYWFDGTALTLEAQFQMLRKVQRLTLDQLQQLTYGMTPVEEVSEASKPVTRPFISHSHNARSSFNLREHVTVRRTDRRNMWAQCPSCARAGRDSHRDNLAIKKDEPHKYKCWAGCSRDDIRAACGYAPSTSDQHSLYRRA
jgi:hypothetical protein